MSPAPRGHDRGHAGGHEPGIGAEAVAAQVLEVETPSGPCRLHTYPVPASAVRRGTVVLGHGAGGGIGARDLQALASALPATGWQVDLVEMAWVVAGRRVATVPPTLDAQWLPVCAQVRDLDPGGLVVVGGRSAGARVACRTATDVGADAVLCLAFPLHPPGRPERSRADELLRPVAAGLPLHVVQGETDAFGTPTEVKRALGRGRARWVSAVAGPHGFARGVGPQVVRASRRFLDALPA